MNRVLFVNTVPTDRNGITNVIFSYIGSDLAKYYILDYVSINPLDSSYSQIVTQSGGEYFVLTRSARSLARYFIGLQRLIRKNRYDIVHIHGNSHTVVLELLAASLSNSKVRIVHAHSTSSNSHLIHLLLTPLFNSLCTGRIACGKEAGKWMFGNRDFTIIKNGINTSKYAFCEKNRNDIREILGFQNMIVMAHVGEFSVNKNQVFLVEVLARLLEESDRYRLLLIGDGGQRSQVLDKAKKMGVSEKIVFTGNIPDVDKYLSASDLILMPSFYEGIPVTLIEQQANGVMCIISETISKDVNLTGNISFLPLLVEDWADKIIRMQFDSVEKRQKRSIDAINKLVETGYDSNSSAMKLKSFYDEKI